jgi:hypothetical protein
VIDASGAEVDPGEYTWDTLYDPSKGTKPTWISGGNHWYDYTNCHGDLYKYDIEVSAKPSSVCYTGATIQAAFRIAAKSLAGMGEADTPETAVKYEPVQCNGQEWDFAAALDDTTGNYVKIPYTGKPITPTVKRITYLNRDLRIAADDWYMRPYDYDYLYIYGNPNPEESNQTSTDPMEVTPDNAPACMTVRHLSSSNFRNYVNIFFKIVPADIATATADIIGDRAYTGGVVEPEIRLALGDVPLRNGTDYTLSYRNNTEPGTAEIIVSGKGNLTGAKTLAFNIVKNAEAQTAPADMTAAAPIDISAAIITPVKTRTYTGKALKPAVNLSYNGAALKNGGDYSIGYANNTIPGKAEIVVTGAGNYAGTKTVYFTIKPSKAKVKKLTAGKKKLTVTFQKPAKAQKATGLQLRYRLKGKAKWKTATVSVKKSNYVIKKLKKGKKYQVQMRIVRTVKTGYAKGSYYGDWSAIKTGKAIK